MENSSMQLQAGFRKMENSSMQLQPGKISNTATENITKKRIW